MSLSIFLSLKKEKNSALVKWNKHSTCENKNHELLLGMLPSEPEIIAACQLTNQKPDDEANFLSVRSMHVSLQIKNIPIQYRCTSRIFLSTTLFLMDINYILTITEEAIYGFVGDSSFIFSFSSPRPFLFLFKNPVDDPNKKKSWKNCSVEFEESDWFQRFKDTIHHILLEN